MLAFVLLLGGCASGPDSRDGGARAPAPTGETTTASSDEALGGDEAAGDDFLTADDLMDDDFGEAASGGPPVADPLEGLNRAIFSFNDGLYTYVLSPVSEGYANVVPRPVRDGIGNVFDNLHYPVRLAGSILQGKGERAFKETGRFLLNTVFGLGGILTPADEVEALQRVPNEDVGQALGVWGIGEGFYLVLPLLGPTTGRDLVGTVGDRAAYPFSEPWTVWLNAEERGIASGVDFLNDSPETMQRYESIKQGSIDLYEAIKDAYIQNRRKAISE